MSLVRLKARREQMRQRLYSTAIAMFRCNGVDGVSVDTIVAAVGVSHGTFYFHFPTKGYVLVEWLSAVEARVDAAIVALPANVDLRVVLHAAVSVIAEEWGGAPALIPDLVREALHYHVRRTGAASRATGATTQASAARRAVAPAALLARLRIAAARGEVTAMLPSDVVAYLCLANVLAGALVWCAEPCVCSLGALLASRIDLILDGVRSPPAAPTDAQLAVKEMNT